MAVPWQVMNKIRSKVREVVGRDIEERFFTFDYSTNQIVSNQKIDGLKTEHLLMLCISVPQQSKRSADWRISSKNRI